MSDYLNVHFQAQRVNQKNTKTIISVSFQVIQRNTTFLTAVNRTGEVRNIFRQRPWKLRKQVHKTKFQYPVKWVSGGSASYIYYVTSDLIDLLKYVGLVLCGSQTGGQTVHVCVVVVVVVVFVFVVRQTRGHTSSSASAVTIMETLKLMGNLVSLWKKTRKWNEHGPWATWINMQEPPLGAEPELRYIDKRKRGKVIFSNRTISSA